MKQALKLTATEDSSVIQVTLGNSAFGQLVGSTQDSKRDLKK